MKNILKFLFVMLSLINVPVFPQPQQVWQDIFSFNNNSSESAIGIGADFSGNTYVLGDVNIDDNQKRDFFLVKYNQQGDTLWTRLYDINPENLLYAKDYFVDSLGNCYLTGSSSNSSTFTTTIVTVKYNSNGDLQFSAAYVSNSYSADVKSMVVEENGIVYVLVDDISFATLIKYNPDGSEVWRKNYLSDIYNPKQLIRDNSGFLIIGGDFNSPTSYNLNLFIMKVNESDGDSLWVQTFDRAGFDDYFTAITVDNQNNIFVGGNAPTSFNYLSTDFAVLKYNSDGQFQWARFYNGPSDQQDIVIDLITDANGNIFVGGNSFDALFLTTSVIIKYSPNGDSLGSITFNGDTINTNSSVNNFNLKKNSLTGPSADFQGFNRDTDLDFADAMLIYGFFVSVNNIPWGLFTMELNPDDLSILIVIKIVLENYDFFEGIANFAGRNEIIATGNATFSTSANVDVITTKFSTTTNVKTISPLPNNYSLEQNYPNPFNPNTTIRWQSPVSSHQVLKVYDILGNEVATLVDGYIEAGVHTVEFNAQNLSSGIYIYKLVAGSFVSSNKMILIK